MKKLSSFVAAAFCLLFLAGCTSPGSTQGGSSSGASSARSSSQSSIVAGSVSGAAGDASGGHGRDAAPPISEAGRLAAVPDFLDEEQTDLYRRAVSVFGAFAGESSVIESFPLWDGTDPDEKPLTEADYYYDGQRRYSPAQGRYREWADFEAMCLSVFTPEYCQELLSYDTYINVDGKLYYIETAMGGRAFYAPEEMPDAFELVEKTADRIAFTLIAHYYVSGYEEGVERHEYTIDRFPIVMQRTPNGWRFSLFAVADFSENFDPSSPLEILTK